MPKMPKVPKITPIPCLPTEDPPGLNHPRFNQYPTSNIQYRISSIKYRATSIYTFIPL